MTPRNWLHPAILGSALGLLPMFGCFGSSNDKGDNSNAGRPLPHDGTKTDDFNKPRDNAATVTPPDATAKSKEPFADPPKPALADPK